MICFSEQSIECAFAGKSCYVRGAMLQDRLGSLRGGGVLQDFISMLLNAWKRPRSHPSSDTSAVQALGEGLLSCRSPDGR